MGGLSISAVTLMELIYGAEKFPAKNLAVIEGFSARLEVLSDDKDAAADTGQLRAGLARAGTSLAPYDQMISGHARSKGLILVTTILASSGVCPVCGSKTGRENSATASMRPRSGNPAQEISRQKSSLRTNSRHESAWQAGRPRPCSILAFQGLRSLCAIDRCRYRTFLG